MKLLRWFRLVVRARQIASSQRADFALLSAARLLRCTALLMVATPLAHASVSLLLEQPYGKLNLFESAGHAAIYLDHVRGDAAEVENVQGWGARRGHQPVRRHRETRLDCYAVDPVSVRGRCGGRDSRDG